MKRAIVILLCCMALFLAACGSKTNEYYEDGMDYLEEKDYIAAEECFEKAMDDDYDENDIETIFTIVSEYNAAKKQYDLGGYDIAEAHLKKIPRSYSEYAISEDVDFLKEQVNNYQEGITYFENKDYVSAETYFKKVVDNDPTQSKVKVLYTIVSEYNAAKKSYNSGDYSVAKTHVEKISNSYSDYSINTDVDFLKDQLKNYEDGITNLELKDYAAAEECFKKAFENDPNQINFKVIYTIVSEYNAAKSNCDLGEYAEAEAHIEKIPHSYTNYSISVDVDALKGQLKNVKDTDVAISKAKSLLESGDYNGANEIIVKIDTKYLTDKQSEELTNLQKEIHLKKKNQDPVTLGRIEALVDTHVNGLCEAVNTGNFNSLSGTLYKGSTIYTEYQSYISYISQLNLSEYNIGSEVISVNWTSETTCVISTIETYRIYYHSTGEYVTKTFRYTYDVIETSDGQLFLTTLRESN